MPEAERLKNQRAGVFVVEDEPIIRLDLLTELESMGFSIAGESGSAEDAIRKIESSRPDVVLMDIRLSGEMDGIKATEIIQSRYNIPVIFLTSNVDKAYIDRAKSVRPYGYIIKPFSSQQLNINIEIALNLDRAEKDRAVAERKLLKSERRYRELVEMTNSIVMKFDSLGRITYLNPFAQRFFGYSEEEIIGKNIVGTILADVGLIGQDLPGMFESILTDPLSYIQNENENITKSGERVWVSWSNKGVFDSDGRLVELLCVGMDMTDTKKLIDIIKTSEERFKELVENSSDWIWELDIKGEYTYCSPVVQDIIKYRPEEVVGQKPFDFMTPRESVRVRAEFEKFVERRTRIEHFETTGISRDGLLVYLNTSAQPIFNGDNELIGFRGITRDISMRKKHETEIAEQRIMLQATLDSLGEAVLLRSVEGKILFANKALAKRFDLLPEELVGTYTRDLLSAHVNESRQNSIKEVLITGKGKKFEEIIGDQIFENHIQPIYFKEKEIQALVVLSIDITDRIKRDAETLTLWTAVEQSHSCIVITDANGIIEYVNPSFYESTGYSSEEAIGQNPRILKTDFHNDDFYQMMWRTISSGKIWKGEICNRKKSGEIFWEQATISPVTNASGNTTHYIAVKEDITSKKEYEKMREDVEHIMRHDLKSPLNSIIGMPQVLLNMPDLSEKQRKYCRIILESGQYMLNMIDSHLNIFKMEAGTYDYQPTQCHLNEIFNSIITDLKRQTEAKKVQIKYMLEGEVCSLEHPLIILSERTLFYSAFSNLIKNAVEASPNEATVDIDVRQSGNSLMIQIVNQGAVPLEIRDSFFEKYSTVGKKNGTGIGTYSAKLLINTMGGEIDMTTSEKMGTIITVVLPSQS